MQTAKRISKGLYEYRGFTIQKLWDHPELDWNIRNSQGNWENTFLTLRECKHWLDCRAKHHISEINELCDEWNSWLERQTNIDDKTIDAQEALFYDISEYQRRYITHFSLRWETAQDDGYSRWKQAQSTEEENA